ncbi:hypothetical protein HY494_01455 [Candidatus Woesearchaeota archaeon]|nr:hypothetical protein [Candidatus Woesearchaeota archaeon]
MESNSHNETELREELKQKRRELSNLRYQLKSIYEQKEAQYQLLNSTRASIKSCLNQISAFKNERDQLTTKVKELKQQRDTFNTLTKEKTNLKEEASKKKNELIGKMENKDNHHENPREIKSLIRKLEHQLETEVMPFPQEEKLRKKVKELQARQKKMGELEEVWKISNAASADAAEVRHKAERFHREVQGTAGLSQQKHQQVNSLYEQLKQLREQQTPLAEKHLQLKEQYGQMKNQLQEIQARVDELSKQFNEKEEKSFKEQIKEKTAQVSEKIKKKQKLNIDDILAFQALDEN